METHESRGSDFSLSRDAFASGQVGSKLWLCEELERTAKSLRSATVSKSETVWIYGGWQGVLGFMLLTRAGQSEAPSFGLRIETVRSFDVDPMCADAANLLCENWVWREWKFRAFTQDCNVLDPADAGEYGPAPTIVINTSVEHFGGREWFEKIPAGTVVVLQASDFEHDGAVALYETEASMAEAFPLSETLFSGRLKFDYGSWKFHRLMLIGVR